MFVVVTGEDETMNMYKRRRQNVCVWNAVMQRSGLRRKNETSMCVV